MAVELARSAGSAALDRAVLKLLQEARFPAFPPSMSQATVTLTIGIQYTLAPHTNPGND